MGNIKRIFALIITLFVISAFSRSTFSEQLHKRQNKDNGLFTPYIPLEPTPNPITRNYEVELSQITLAPDGFTKTIFAINGQYPGTVIHANKGDRIQVTVKNNIGEPSGKLFFFFIYFVYLIERSVNVFHLNTFNNNSYPLAWNVSERN